MSTPFLRSILPALVVGTCVGYFVGAKYGTAEATPRESAKKSTLRSEFLSNDKDVVDYDKLASVCLMAANRGVPQTTARASAVAESNSQAVIEVKEQLDEVMSLSLEDGVWSRGAGMKAEKLLGLLPPSDVAEFEKLLRTTLERGDMKPQHGAWIPETIN